jgi:hypothetical protein
MLVYYPLDYESIEASENWEFSILMMFYVDSFLWKRSNHFVIGLYQNAFNDTPYSSYDIVLFRSFSNWFEKKYKNCHSSEIELNKDIDNSKYKMFKCDINLCNTWI